MRFILPSSPAISVQTFSSNTRTGVRVASTSPLNVVILSPGGSSVDTTRTTTPYSSSVMRSWPENRDPAVRSDGYSCRPSSSNTMRPVVVLISAWSHAAITSFSPRLKRPRLSACDFFSEAANSV